MISRRASGFALLASALAFALSVALASPTLAVAASWPVGVTRVAMDATRVVGPGVYGEAVAGAKAAYPEWGHVSDVVIASGETGALSDAAAASSLCWAYDAPLLLTSRSSLPQVTRDALAEIISANPTVTVHVVGSVSAIPAGRVAQIASVVGTAAVERPWPAADKYSLAAGIAARVREVAAQTGATIPSAALVVDGSSTSHLWDAAAAASVARHTGVPLLYAGRGQVPASTAAALSAAGTPEVVVVGGTGAVSSAMYAKLRASERWSGNSRASTAASVARRGAARGWISLSQVALASTVSNAIVGGSLAGSRGGAVLVTDVARLAHTSWSLLAEHASELSTGYAVGGDSVDGAQLSELRGGPSRPWFTSGSPGRYVGRRATLAGGVGGNVTTVAVFVGGKKARSVDVKPWGRFNISSVAMPGSSGKVSVVASNPDGGDSTVSRTVHRLKYPYPTCIVIDKSQFKLYWVKNNRLVRAFPIAVGRLGMETPPATWKILAKYHTSPGSVYGPRKMRLFRHRGGRWVFSRYGIHGTNQPWVIGSKASHGCIRMYNRDVLKLFPLVKLGTIVVTRE